MAVIIINLRATLEDVNFPVTRGDTTPATITFYTNTDPVAPIDMTGKDIKMDIKVSALDVPTDTFSTDSSDITITGSSILIEGWERLPVGVFKYDLQVSTTSPITNVTYIAGEITVYQDITT